MNVPMSEAIRDLMDLYLAHLIFSSYIKIHYKLILIRGKYYGAFHCLGDLISLENYFEALQWIVFWQAHVRPAILVVNTPRVSLTRPLQGCQDYCRRYKDFLGITIDFGLIQPILGSM